MAAGDHIYVYCRGYSHHGIDCGDGTVIHFDATPWQQLRRDREREGTIKRVVWDEFAQGRPVYVRPYDRVDSLDIVLARAQSRLGHGGYDLFGNNCEHFAVWCKTGNPISTQILSAVDAARPVVGNLPVAWVLFRGARYLPGPMRWAVYATALSVTAGRGLVRYVRNRVDNVQLGES